MPLRTGTVRGPAVTVSRCALWQREHLGITTCGFGRLSCRPSLIYF